MYRNLTKHPLVNRKVVVSFCHYNAIMNPVHVSCYTSSSCLQFLKVELQSQRDIYQILIVPKCPSKGYIQLLTNHHQMSQPVFLTSTNTGIKSFKVKWGSSLNTTPVAICTSNCPVLLFSHAVHQFNWSPGWVIQGKRVHSADPPSCLTQHLHGKVVLQGSWTKTH